MEQFKRHEVQDLMEEFGRHDIHQDQQSKSQTQAQRTLEKTKDDDFSFTM